MDRARPAQREATTELGAGHTQDVAHHPERRRVVIDIDAVGLPVDADGECHVVLSFSWDDGIGRYFGIRRDAGAGWGSRRIAEVVLELVRAGVVSFSNEDGTAP